jgi:monoamine oxidase
MTGVTGDGADLARRAHGGRRSLAAREVKQRSIESIGAGGPGTAVDEAWSWSAFSRRELLFAGGGLGAAMVLAGAGRASASTGRKSPTDARVVIVGAGLAGIAAAYQLHRVGVTSAVYEARDRLGGRCWTARGFADGQTAEHGGEFIDTRHVHLRQLVRELGLELDDLFAARSGPYSPNWVRGRDLTQHEINVGMRRVQAAVAHEARRVGVLRGHGRVDTAAYSYPTATPQAVAVDRLSMAEWLDVHVRGVLGSALGEWLDQTMSGWYGLNLDRLSALNWIDYLVVPSPGADERWHVRGGNDQVIHRAAATLPAASIHTGTPLRAIRRRAGGSYALDFDGVPGPVIADLVVLTVPFTTLREVDTQGAEFSAHKLAAIHKLAMGSDAKVIVQYDTRPWKLDRWSSLMTSSDPDFDTWESSAHEPGQAGLITVYAGGRTGQSWRGPAPHAPATPGLRDSVLDRVDQAVPGSRAHFNGHAWADLWPRDPWTRGSYAAFAPGQYTRFWRGLGKPEGNVHFAGEATSTYSQGYLNGGVESGDRTALEIMRKLRIPLPRHLTKLPYSPP